MQVARVIGDVVATIKDANLTGHKLLVLQPLTPRREAQGRCLIAIDACGADYELSLDLKDPACGPAVIAAVREAAPQLTPRLWLCSPHLSVVEPLRELDAAQVDRILARGLQMAVGRKVAVHHGEGRFFRIVIKRAAQEQKRRPGIRGRNLRQEIQELWQPDGRVKVQV